MRDILKGGELGFPPLQVAEIIREPGEDPRVVAAQHRTFLQRRLVHVRATEGSGRNATQLCGPGDLAVTKILRIVTSLGISDNSFMEAASNACYSWREEHKPSARTAHPITDAILGSTLGESWYFRADLVVDDQTGGRRILAKVYNADTEDLGDPFLPLGAIVIPTCKFAERIISAKSVAATSPGNPSSMVNVRRNVVL